MKSLAVAGVFAGLLLLVFLASYFFYGLGPVPSEDGKVDFRIEKGSGFKEIAASLEGAGLIKSAVSFKIYAVVFGLAHRLKPGEYSLDRNLSVPKIAEILAAGPAPDVSVTIIEGMTVKEIDELLSSLSIIRAGVLLKERERLEGRLFPDTYRFFKSSPPEAVIEKFLVNFKEKTNGWGLTSEALILASLLEKEIPDRDERFLAADVLLKRWRKGMPLQVDSSLCYAKMFSFNGCSLKKKDYRLDSPYNTYRHAGWPPTPISNPSLESIEAALNPKESDFWYYLSDPLTRKTVFAKTLDEHNRNRVKYLGF